MSILARNSISVFYVTDIESVTWYYKLQASTATAPSKPTTATPSGWSTTEPTYTEGSTNSLYMCQKTLYSDGTFSYSDVSLSSSYEAAKTAYNKSVAALAASEQIGTIEAPYTEVEWVESTGKQYVYLDWKPPIATWGFEIDFISRNACNTTGPAWNESTNVNGYGTIFGCRNASGVNDISLSSYTANGWLKVGGSSISGHGFKTDHTRQTMKLHGTTLTKPDGTTKTITRVSETANKPYTNIVVFASHNQALRQQSYGGIVEPASVRIYSLKFYNDTTLTVDLVGAIRKSDGITGLYDKVSQHFYPAPGMLYGDDVGDIGVADTLAEAMAKADAQVTVVNKNQSRMWRANVPFHKLEDGQKLAVVYCYGGIANSVETTELADWNDTGNNQQVYLKLTFPDGTTSEWIPCYYNNNSRLTSHYPAGMPILFTYRENVIGSATATGSSYPIMRGFFGGSNYDTNTHYTIYANAAKAGANGVKRYTLIMRDTEDSWTSIVNEASTTAKTKTVYTGGFILGKILYSANGAEYAAGANTSTIYDCYGFNLQYSLNIDTSGADSLTAHRPVYLVGTIGNDGKFYLDTTKWWTQTEPSTEDGKVYIFIGQTYSAYQAFLSTENPAYMYYDGAFRKVEDVNTLVALASANDALGSTVESIKGTQTVSTRFWTGTSTLHTELKDGMQISYWLPYASKSETAQSKGITASELRNWETVTSSYGNDWLKLTLADGTTTDWIPVYYGGTTRLTTHYGVNNVIKLTYKVGIGSTVSGWWADGQYYYNSSYTQFATAVKPGANGIRCYSLIMKDTDDTWTCFFSSAYNGTNTGKTAYTGGFILGKVCYSSGAGQQTNNSSLDTYYNYKQGVNTTTIYDCYPLDFRYSSNCATTLTAYKPIYLVGTINNDGLFHLDTTQWWTQTIPTAVDNKVYVYLGDAYSTYQIWLATENPAYQYYDGKFRTLEDIASLTALTAANGKNKVFHQSSQPSSSLGLSVGDTWFDTANGYKINTWNGTQWVAEQLDSPAIATGAIKASNIDAGAVTADKIGAHAVTAAKIDAGAVNAEKLSVGEFTNFATINQFIPETMCAISGRETVTASSGGAVTSYGKKTPTQQYLPLNTVHFANSFKTGDQLYYDITARSTANAGDVTLNVSCYDASKTYVAGNGATLSLTSSHKQFTGSITLSNAAFDTAAFIFIYINDNRGTNGSGREQIYIKSAQIFRKTKGDLIIDGAVTADKIDSGAVTTDKLDALAVTAAKIAANAVEAGKIKSGAVTTDKLDALAVTAAKIAANAVEAGKIKSGAVTTDKLDALAVTAAKLAADAVEAGKIKSGAVTTDKLDALAVTAAKIAANAVEAGKIKSGAVTTDKLDALAVTAAKIAAGAITTDKLDALAVTAAKIAAGAITTDKLDANAVTATMISGKTISSGVFKTDAGGTVSFRYNKNTGGISDRDTISDDAKLIMRPSGFQSLDGSNEEVRAQLRPALMLDATNLSAAGTVGWYLTPVAYIRRLFMDSGEAASKVDVNTIVSSVVANLIATSTPSTGVTGVSGIVHAIGIVTVRFSSISVPANTAANTTIATLAAAYRPAVQMDLLSTNNNFRFTIGTDGTIKPSAAVTSATPLRGTFTYIGGVVNSGTLTPTVDYTQT